MNGPRSAMVAWRISGLVASALSNSSRSDGACGLGGRRNFTVSLMGLFGKLFSKRVDRHAERARRLFEQTLEDSKKPQGIYKMAGVGAEIRHQLINLIEEVEAEIGQSAIGFAQDVGVMGVHRKLIERLSKEPDGGLFESALQLAFPTPDATRRFNEQWPAAVGKYYGRHNTEELLREKSNILASFIVHNSDIATTISVQTRAVRGRQRRPTCGTVTNRSRYYSTSGESASSAGRHL
jgi:hypothetical protein